MTARRRTGYATIYALVHPDSREIRYVGKTLAVPGDRLRSHILAARRGVDTYVARWIRSLEAEPALVVLEMCAEDEGSTAERRWIAEFRSQGVRLTNLTDGGEGVPGFHMSVEAREKIRQAAIGRRYPPDVIARMAASKRTPGSPESRFDADGRPRRSDPATRDHESGIRLARRWDDDREGMIAVARKGGEAARVAAHSGEASAKRRESLRQSWASLTSEQRAARGAAISAGKRGL